MKKMLPTSLIQNSGMCIAKTVKCVYEAHLTGVGFSMPCVYFKISNYKIETSFGSSKMNIEVL